jgi:methyltransferase (TIGR00027 family)
MIPHVTSSQPSLPSSGKPSGIELINANNPTARHSGSVTPEAGCMMAETLGDKLISWQQDYSKRMSPNLLTGLLRKAVPVLDAVQWKVVEVNDQECQSVLPAGSASTNQHGTHQAALISLAADYTGGIALATLIRGVPVIGVHPCSEGNAASMWLASMKVKYRRPSTTDLHGRCAVPDEMIGRVKQRFAAGKRVLITLHVEFTDAAGQPIADAEMRYFLQARNLSNHGRDRKKKQPRDDAQGLKASARLVAGLRANISRCSNGFEHRYDELAAGPHGAVLAERLTNVLPQLQEVVTARTLHIDHFLQDSEEIQQVVLLGAGLDMRPFRMADRGCSLVTFELDLPVMLQERRLVLSNLSDQDAVDRYMLEADFKHAHVGERLQQCSAYDPDVPTLVIYEGCSMYFSEQENRALMMSVRGALRNPNSAVWADMVIPSVVDGSTDHAAITEFLKQMKELGETFVFGCDDPARFLGECGFGAGAVVTAQEYLKSCDPSLGTYQFVVSGICA